MQDSRLFKYSTQTILFFVALFSFFVLIYFIIQLKYMHDVQKNHTQAIKQEVKLLIELKENQTFDLAKTISLDKKLIKIMKTKAYEKLYAANTFPTAQKIKSFKNLKLHIVDAEGMNRYLSWTNKSVGKYVLNVRKDLKELYLNPQPMKNISVGKFGLTFKGVMPIFDKHGIFLGIVEVITHFNSISRHLAKDDIHTALIIDKRFTKQLVHPFSNKFIDGYNIATLNLYPDVKHFLQTKGIGYFINTQKVSYIKKSIREDGYYVLNVPILGVLNDTIGYFIVFIYDKYSLEKKEIAMFFITIVMTLLFFFVSYLVYKAYKNNKYLIDTLHTKVKEQTEKNLRLVYHDQLTGAYKKEKLLADKDLYKTRNLVMLNIRNFSQINATYGFNVGDLVLQISTKKLEDILAQKIYRINADEFVFITDNILADIEKIKEHFKDLSINIADENLNIRLSFSFAALPGNEDEVLRKLSIALKQAKKELFKSYVPYQEQSLDEEFLKFNSYLYDAIFSQNKAKFVPYFQGIMHNNLGRIFKYEALARLVVGEKVYTPYFFINIAKNSGFLYEITKIMIEKSFAFLSQQPEEVVISINITEDDLLTKNLMKYLTQALRKHKIKASRVTLEILEGISSSGTKNNIVQLKELKELGFLLAIDDFGVEYSNFERINELDIDFIKIDGKYIKNIDTNQKSYKIAKAITGFASSMGIQVIAEFVENESIQNIIEDLGIEYSQGFYFSKPSPTI